jgi:transcription elongation factor Elf1
MVETSCHEREETSKALEKSNMVYSSVGYCECGYEVWIEYLWNGKEWYQRFFDVNHHEIETCRECGKELKEDDLESLSD